MALLEVKKLSKIYKNNRGIKELDLTIEPGEVVALLGPNGAGKTTAIKTMLGYVNKTEGQVQLCGYCLENVHKSLRKTGVIVGQPMPYDFLSGYKNLELHASLYPHIGKEDIMEALEAVALTPYKDERVKGYSTGMKERLAFAKAIVHKPELLLLDEPFSGLDIEGKMMMKQLIKKLSEDGVGVLISSHLIHDIEDIATKVCIIHNHRWLVTESVPYILDGYSSLEDYYLHLVQGKAVAR